MRKVTLPLLLLTVVMHAVAQQQALLNRQRHFAATVPPGNYSGITWMGGDRYAVVDDKSPTAGFHLMTIRTDSTTGDIVELRADTFMTSGQPNRDEEGICYVPSSNTLFVSGEADGQIVEYGMDGRLTGRRLHIPEVFATAQSNSGFEALTYNAATARFWTTTEKPLRADIQPPTPTPLRLQSFGNDLQPREQYRYQTDSSAVTTGKGSTTLGVSALAALDDGRIVVLEREVHKTPSGVGSFVHVKLYMVHPTSQQPGELLNKRLLAEFRTRINLTARSFANYEGLCAGPTLADGSQLLVLVADSQNQYKGWLKDWFKTVVIPVGW